MTQAANLASVASIIQAPTGTAPAYQCRAWVNFNGTGTVAIRASGNVSSITDNGSGDYTVNFATAMPDANYSVEATAGGTSGVPSTKCPPSGGSLSVSSANVQTVNGAGSFANFDCAYVLVSIFR